MNLISKLHDAVFEEDDKKPAQTVVPVSPPPTVTATMPVTTISMSIPSDGGNMYEHLKADTDFSKGVNLQKIFALEKPLEGIITDPQLRLKAAVAQAAGQGVTPQMIAADLALLAQQIDGVQAGFELAAKNKTTAIAVDEQKAADLEKQLHDLRQDVTDRKTKLDHAQYEFNSAVTRRRAELNQLKARFVF